MEIIYVDGNSEVRTNSKMEAVDGSVEQMELHTINKADGSSTTTKNIYTLDTKKNTTVKEILITVDKDGTETKSEHVTVTDINGEVISETQE